MDAAINGTNGMTMHLYDPSATATPGSGSMHYRIRSYNQVKAENPSLTNGQAWKQALDSGSGTWQRWWGQNMVPGVTYYLQFKWRFSPAWTSRWGGGGPKLFGMDGGCRYDPRDPTRIIPKYCDTTLGLPANLTQVTGMGTAMSMEFGTTTTDNWPAASLNKPNRARMATYYGSVNFSGTLSMYPSARTVYGSDTIMQNGRDANGAWNPTTGMIDKPCSFGFLVNDPDYAEKTGACVLYGAPDTWHVITVALRWSGNYFNTNRFHVETTGTVTPGSNKITGIGDVSKFIAGNPIYFTDNSLVNPIAQQFPTIVSIDDRTPGAGVITVSTPLTLASGVTTPTAGRLGMYESRFRHDSMFKLWFDGKLVYDFDPDAAPFKLGQITNAECAQRQEFIPPHDVCRTGIDLIRDSRDVPPASQCDTATSWCSGGSYPVYKAPWIPGDNGADLTQFIIVPFSYRRGRPDPGNNFCESQIGTSAPEYKDCAALRASGDAPADFQAFLNHAAVDVFYDDWIVSTTPLPLTLP